MCVIANVSSGKLVFGAQCLMATSNNGTDFVQIAYSPNHKIKMINAVQFSEKMMPAQVSQKCSTVVKKN